MLGCRLPELPPRFGEQTGPGRFDILLPVCRDERSDICGGACAARARVRQRRNSWIESLEVIVKEMIVGNLCVHAQDMGSDTSTIGEPKLNYLTTVLGDVLRIHVWKAVRGSLTDRA